MKDRQLRIAVVGGGPGGLVLTRMLHRHGIPVTVFERDQSRTVRGQGGSLDMHAETGQYALRSCGLEGEFERVARYEDQGSRLYNKFGKLMFDEVEGGEGDRPEVDRGQLRTILLDSFPEETVRWNHALSTAVQLEDGSYSLQFENGAAEYFDLVVGADGAWSRVRPLVSDARPEYTGVTFIESGIDDVDALHPEVAALVGRGKAFALGECKGVLAQRNSNAHIRIYAGLRIEEDWIVNGSLDLSSTEATRAALLAMYPGWSESVLELIRCSEWFTPRPLYALPIGHNWKNRDGVTLLGDAAHLMSPFSGEGANLAMRDGADLALALIEEPDWHEAVRRFEAVMLPRAAEAAAGAMEGVQGAFAEDALDHVLDHVREVELHHMERRV